MQVLDKINKVTELAYYWNLRDRDTWYEICMSQRRIRLIEHDSKTKKVIMCYIARFDGVVFKNNVTTRIRYVTLGDMIYLLETLKKEI